jgi:hypothetical protein
MGRYGIVKFELWGSRPTEGPICIRAVSVWHDGRQWRFATTGEAQPFEEPERYTAPRVRNRFTLEMLEQYCKAVGVDYFDPDFYGPKALLIEHNHSWRQICVGSLEEVQRQLGLSPPSPP